MGYTSEAAPLQSVLCHVSLSQSVIMHGVDYSGHVMPMWHLTQWEIDLVRPRPTRTYVKLNLLPG